MRDARDLDIIVTKPVFGKLQKRPEIKTTEFEGVFGKTAKLQFGEIEIFKDWAPGRWNIDELIKNAQEISGQFFVQKEEVIKWKTLKGREKDKEDLRLLSEISKD